MENAAVCFAEKLCKNILANTDLNINYCRRKTKVPCVTSSLQPPACFGKGQVLGLEPEALTWQIGDKMPGYTLEDCLESVGPGWADLVRKAWDITQKHDGCVVQVKEKYGTLRFYTGSDYAGISEIERESAYVCEMCGRVGRVRSEKDYPGNQRYVWLRTLCDECFVDLLIQRCYHEADNDGR